jgi:aspartyl aminopeptidase
VTHPNFIQPTDDAHAYAGNLMRFIDASPTPWHAVHTVARALEQHGYTRLNERQPWALHDDEGYYVVRGGGSLVAFRTGTSTPREAGFRLIGAHTDSPNLRIKHRVGKAAHGHLQFDVEPYGGLLVATWADRDLALAGRVFVRGAEGTTEHLIHSGRAVCRIPNLAIHLNRTVNDDGLKLNKHSHLSPVTALWDSGDPAEFLQRTIAEWAGVDATDVLGHELCLFDVQPGGFVGIDDAYISIARLDNLGMSYGALTALLADAAPTEHGRVISLFDHEEVGSLSTSGANSSLMRDVLGRLAGDGADALPRAIACSHQVSADMAHALHPNYADRHDGTHMPHMNAGPVIKTNVNQRYATNGETGSMFRQVCSEAGVPVQEFVNRPDLGCGTTIGPISAGQLGLRTVDVGNPMWAMHSIREMAGTKDALWMHQALTTYLSMPGLG